MATPHSKSPCASSSAPPDTAMPPPPLPTTAQPAATATAVGSTSAPTISRVVVAEFPFKTPTKCIRTNQDVDIWLHSKAFAFLMTFLGQLNESVQGLANSYSCPVSPVLTQIIAMLDRVNALTDQFPPQVSSLSRYGNPTFRSWMNALKKEAATLHAEHLPMDVQPALVELEAYFTGAFGNETRIDYGSGHELSFLVWLVCLDRLGLFQLEDRVALVTRVFAKYLEVVRRLQLAYKLEPAGSHGVWGLDDYQFVPFIFGSAQFIGSVHSKPTVIADKDVANELAPEYMLMRCIQFTNEVKTGPFFEHSPTLYSISGVPYWKKVNQGLQKMYVGDTLSKFPVVQHLPFGNLMPFERM
ncbi:Serine/threonine-protein phosphatase 2A activator 1 [Dimargaris verticillata]|uniref:Serine/threonine-protein phosphatase 2A activator n=1 Tax=Dimargaris verticillata TaxID=2761393 RepID=A0A9W8B3S0_9FUNG|nr:Serine/threonine-protein phosphatase 2A activator 1 [Dimargaris verticillata]